jgi:hypothetical protein
MTQQELTTDLRARPERAGRGAVAYRTEPTQLHAQQAPRRSSVRRREVAVRGAAQT